MSDPVSPPKSAWPNTRQNQVLKNRLNQIANICLHAKGRHFTEEERRRIYVLARGKKLTEMEERKSRYRAL